MTRFNNRTNKEIIRKVHLLLGNVEAGEEVIDYLRATEPVFMTEVGKFVTIELDKLKKDFEEEFLMYLGSIIGAAYIMGFLIAREMDHKTYDGLINFESLLEDKHLDVNYIDKLIDSELEKGKKPKDVGKSIKKYLKDMKGSTKKKAKTSKSKKISSAPKRKKLKIEFNEGEL